jgi:hypothetical protein
VVELPPDADAEATPGVEAAGAEVAGADVAGADATIPEEQAA